MGFKCPDRGKLTNPIFIVAPFVRSDEPQHSIRKANVSRLMFSEKFVPCEENNAEPALFHGVQRKEHIPPAATSGHTGG
jgi:hypothetical protein